MHLAAAGQGWGCEAALGGGARRCAAAGACEPAGPLRRVLEETALVGQGRGASGVRVWGAPGPGGPRMLFGEERQVKRVMTLDVAFTAALSHPSRASRSRILCRTLRSRQRSEVPMPDITRACDSMAFKTIATVKVINGSITPQSPLLLFRLRRSIWWEEHNIKSTLSTHCEVHSTESLTVGAMLVSRSPELTRPARRQLRARGRAEPRAPSSLTLPQPLAAAILPSLCVGLIILDSSCE